MSYFYCTILIKQAKGSFWHSSCTVPCSAIQRYTSSTYEVSKARLSSDNAQEVVLIVQRHDVVFQICHDPHGCKKNTRTKVNLHLTIFSLCLSLFYFHQNKGQNESVMHYVRYSVSPFGTMLNNNGGNNVHGQKKRYKKTDLFLSYRHKRTAQTAPHLHP